MKKSTLPVFNQIEMRYLYLFPHTNSNTSLEHLSLHSPKGAPYFFEHDIDVKSYKMQVITLKNIEVELSVQIIDDQVWLYDCHYTLPSTGNSSLILTNHTVQEAIKTYIHKTLTLASDTMFEQYTIVLATQKESHPDDYIDNHKDIFAGLIRTFYDKNLDKSEIRDILSTRVRYSEYDLVVIDWNGAVIVTDDGDFSSDIDLLKIGNYQLIRYRMIDEQLEQKLNYLQETLGNKKTPIRNTKKILQDIIDQRLSIVLTLEKIDTSLLLIGDWYSSKFYSAIVDEFYTDTWRGMVQSKLDNLKSLHEMMSEHFSLSWRRLIDQATFIGWFVMMLGYFILFFVDIGK
jgi:hypothetical protein